MMEMNDFFVFVLDKQDVIIRATLQHIYISLTAVILGALVAIPVGIGLTRNKKVANYILGIAGVLQTIPSMVLFGLALPVLGMGMKSALVVLFLYSLLPIMRNTYIGIREVNSMYIESAKGMGMGKMQILWSVELPLALPVIVAGIRISLVYIVSWATVAALIGAGGLGDLIWTGLQSYDKRLILAGAIPASILALAVGAGIGALQKAVTPRGIKL